MITVRWYLSLKIEQHDNLETVRIKSKKEDRSMFKEEEYIYSEAG
jgi:hypothetical protein